MTTAFARVRFSGDYGGTFFMSQLVGAAKARQLYFLSERVSAEQALDLGLTNWVCDADELAAKTKEIARLNGDIMLTHIRGNTRNLTSASID